MISYELAKKLKDAGFLQAERVNPSFYPEEGKGYDPNSYNNTKDMVIKIPTLSELIEACGDGIFQLLRHSEWHKNEIGFSWQALMAQPQKATELTGKEIERITTTEYGSTPEEAVANLWLKLNQKHGG